MSAARSADFASSVFLNCPFDDKYKPLLHAALFAIYDCGFEARHALEDVGGKESRLAKICRLIEQSRWSIHDLSRVELARASRLPRFNMPFECGLAYGAMRFGSANQRDMLVMSAMPFQDKASISDLAGIDPSYHRNDPALLIAAVRRFLAAKSAHPVRGAKMIAGRYQRFQTVFLPAALKLHSKGITLREVQSLDFINDWVRLVTDWMVTHP